MGPVDYVNNKLAPAGPVEVEVDINTGYVSVVSVQKGLIDPCKQHATDHGMRFCNFKSLGPYDEKTKLRRVVYTAIPLYDRAEIAAWSRSNGW